jgi:hypothetical protein
MGSSTFRPLRNMEDLDNLGTDASSVVQGAVLCLVVELVLFGAVGYFLVQPTTPSPIPLIVFFLIIWTPLTLIVWPGAVRRVRRSPDRIAIDGTRFIGTFEPHFLGVKHMTTQSVPFSEIMAIDNPVYGPKGSFKPTFIRFASGGGWYVGDGISARVLTVWTEWRSKPGFDSSTPPPS